jgi:hypothetical protein
MFHELLSLIANAVPTGLFFHEFMKGIGNAQFVIKTIGRYREGLATGRNFSEGGTATRAEAPVVLVGRLWDICHNIFGTRDKFEITAPDEYKGARSNFSTARAMTRPHHRRRGGQ